jgi:hypothetical protein
VLLDTEEQMPMRSAKSMPLGREGSLNGKSCEANSQQPNSEERNGWLWLPWRVNGLIKGVIRNSGRGHEAGISEIEARKT